VRACTRPGESCIRLNDAAKMTLDRGQGRQLTKEECHQLIIKLDRQGLMHTGDRRWKEKGQTFGFCNCCACDCYPFRAGISLGMHQKWPRSHHIAVFDEQKCNECGLCAKRCHFGAFHFTDETVIVKGHVLQKVAFEPEKCWGCGLCATGCTKSAITMVPLPADVLANAVPDAESVTVAGADQPVDGEMWLHD
jgi:ferredoxin